MKNKTIRNFLRFSGKKHCQKTTQAFPGRGSAHFESSEGSRPAAGGFSRAEFVQFSDRSLVLCEKVAKRCEFKCSGTLAGSSRQTKTESTPSNETGSAPFAHPPQRRVCFVVWFDFQTTHSGSRNCSSCTVLLN